MTSEMDAPHPAGFIEMRKRSLQSFASLAKQPFASLSPNAPTVAIDRVASLGVLLPMAPSAIGFRDVTPQAHRFEIHERLIAVIALVPDDLFETIAIGHDHLNLLGRIDQGLSARGRVALIRVLHRDRHNRAGLQVDRVLGLVSKVRPAILHLRDFRVGIVRMLPVVVRALVLPLAIEARHVLARGRRDARGLRQPRQELLVTLSGVTPHDTAQRRVGFQRRRVDPDRLSLDEIRRIAATPT